MARQIQNGNDCFESEDDVARYNEAALAVASGVLIDDLYATAVACGVDKYLSADGLHPDVYGNEVLAEAVRRPSERPLA